VHHIFFVFFVVMNKISKLFKAISLIVTKPSLLNKVLDDAGVNRSEVTEKFKLSNGLRTISITDLIPDLDITVDPFCYLDGGSTPIDLALLKALAKRQAGCEYFEVGTWRGESVANVASVAKHCTSLNLPDDEMIKMGLQKKYVDLHRFFSQKLPNVTHIQANSLTFDYSLLKKKFDLIFIDGDHHFESVMTDTRNAFTLLKDDNSIIVWHDYGHSPNDVRWDVLRGILEGTPPDKRDKLFRVSNTLCAIYINSSVRSYQQETFETPDKIFSINIVAKGL
jgi:hypothetical protein